MVGLVLAAVAARARLLRVVALAAAAVASLAGRVGRWLVDWWVGETRVVAGDVLALLRTVRGFGADVASHL